MKIKTAFSVIDAIDWFRAEAGKDSLKVLSGMRGSGKSTTVEMYRNDLLNHGVRQENILHLDFEDRRMRSIKSSRDVLALLPPEDEDADGGDRKAKRTCLILDEITCLVDFERLMGVLYSRSDLDVLLTISNRRLMTESVRGYFEDSISECRLFPGPGLRRTQNKLDSIWAEVLLRDVLGGHVLADATAIEQLAGYLSDHLCDVISKRKVAAEFTVGGAPLAANTVGAYLDLLGGAYLVEFAPVYDMFSEEVVKNAGRRVFWVDPVLREHRFGPAIEGEGGRAAYNARYLELRKRYGRVYCVKDEDKLAKYPDFVVFPGSGKTAEVKKWKKF